MNGDWLLRLALLAVVGGALAFAAVLLEAGMQSALPEGQYEVLHAVADPGGRHHAVVFRFRPSDAISHVSGVWIVPGTTLPVGTRMRPDGAPVAIWSEGRPQINWRDGRLVLAGDHAKVLSAAEKLASCHGSEWQLCLDPRHVTYVKLPR